MAGELQAHPGFRHAQMHVGPGSVQRVPSVEALSVIAGVLAIVGPAIDLVNRWHSREEDDDRREDRKENDPSASDDSSAG